MTKNMLIIYPGASGMIKIMEKPGVKAYRPRLIFLGILICLFFPKQLPAGPPFRTDDPEPVELHHWEVYILGDYEHSPGADSAAFPALELNYGAIKNLQVHLIVPYAFAKTDGEPLRTGIGDIELGLKYRILDETGKRPMVGVFPLLEFPAGNADQGLGAGRYQIFLPVWLQKSWGDWTSYGGGGYWIVSGAADQDSWLLGWEIQKDINDHLMLGGEIFSAIPGHDFSGTQLNFNLGGQYNFNDQFHLLFSAGRSIYGDTDFMSYLAVQWTLGPREEKTNPARAPHLFSGNSTSDCFPRLCP
jgi:hypothetical protein